MSPKHLRYRKQCRIFSIEWIHGIKFGPPCSSCPLAQSRSYAFHWPAFGMSFVRLFRSSILSGNVSTSLPLLPFLKLVFFFARGLSHWERFWMALPLETLYRPTCPNTIQCNIVIEPGITLKATAICFCMNSFIRPLSVCQVKRI